MKLSWSRIVEGGIILVGILSIWPMVLGVRSIWYMVFMLLVLVALAVLAVVRLRRVKHALETHRDAGPGDAHGSGR